MSPFDGTVVSVALPKLSPALHLGFVGALWIQAIYLLPLTVLLVPAGRLADAWGGMRLYRLGLVLFALTSAAAGASSSATFMLGARCAQGVAAALLSATSTALVTEAFPPSERGKALGINVTAVYVGLAAGPVLGGLLTEQVGWRSIFYVNLPVAVASLAWGWRLGGDRRSGPFRLDLAGVGLLAGGLGLTLVGVTLAPVWGWTMPS
ncbi:MAG: MFS transporter, partial [Acidimicrobiales bacterium]|nr:MFS transporter [Acidimicrobiales bacterium]